MIFTKFSNLFFSFQWLFQCFCQVIIPKKILTQVPTAKKLPKNAKKSQFWSPFWAFYDPFLSFWRPSLGRELRGYRTVFLYVSLQNMKKYNIFMPGMHGTPCHHYKSKPLKPSTNARGVVKTQILPKICCQILHLCISYSNKTGFTHCAMVKLKCKQFSTMVWPTSESSTGP